MIIDNYPTTSGNVAATTDQCREFNEYIFNMDSFLKNPSTELVFKNAHTLEKNYTKYVIYYENNFCPVKDYHEFELCIAGFLYDKCISVVFEKPDEEDESIMKKDQYFKIPLITSSQ